MIRRSLVIVPALAVGASLAGAIYWLFLNTLESNVLMLLASTLLALAWLFVVAVTVNCAVLMAYGAPASRALGPAARGIGWFIVAATPLVVAWWLLGRADSWIATHSGEIQAWIIARTGWADTTPLLTAELWVSRWLRWTVLPMLAVSLLAALLIRTPTRRRLWPWRTLLTGVLVFVFLLWLPWHLAEWRPVLPSTWVQPTVAAIRLAAVFLFVTLGAAIMIVAAVGAPRHAR